MATLGLAGCSTAEHIAYAPVKGDAKPHPGVAHAQKYAIHGVDISKWQGEVDFQALKESGTKFVFIKATEGGDHLDERFARNWAGARAAGLHYGAYHFVYWCRPAHEQAAWFKQHIPNDPNAMPPVLDLEWNGESRTCPKKIPAEDARAKIKIMLDELEALTGKKPIIYTDITFHKDVLEGYFNEYPFWLRSVASDPEEKYNNRRWAIWQYTTTGRLPGVVGNIDRNTFYGTREQWAMFTGQRQPATPKVMTAEPKPAEDTQMLSAIAMAPM